MTDTPRTDAAAYGVEGTAEGSTEEYKFGPRLIHVSADFARTLERELERERAKVRTLRSATDLLMTRVNDELKSGRPALIAVQWHRIEPIIAALAAMEDAP